jgi:hypothetical protein
VFRQIGAVVAGYAVWTVLWLGLGSVLRAMAILPAADAAAIENTPPLLVLLAGSIIASLVAGFVVAVITKRRSHTAGSDPRPAVARDGRVRANAVQLMPVWYHVAFLALLMPVCIVGFRLRAR